MFLAGLNLPGAVLGLHKERFRRKAQPGTALPYPGMSLGRTSPHFSPGSRKQAQDSCSKAPLWSEKRSNGYGLSEEQAYGHED